MFDAAKALGVDPLNWVLTGGDDHALVAVFPPYADLPPEWKVIGKVNHGTGVTVDGRTYAGQKGWDHFQQRSPYDPKT
jgi:thiamine-monophosphate kinase